MSSFDACVVAFLVLGACYLSFRLGQDDVLRKMRDFKERNRRWREFDDID